MASVISNPVQDHKVTSIREKEPFRNSNTQYLNLPSSLHDVQKLVLSGIEHQGITMVGNSLRAHRSSNKAIIFLYGITGSGKSSTLNHLFNTKDMLEVSEVKSCTKDVAEYVVTMSSDDYKLNNLEIGFIDTPGWNDTSGTLQDAVNLASVTKFLQQHPLLNSKWHSLFPNIVLIVVSACDKRLGGESSDCAHMLRALSKLHVVDQSRPNVVFVLTNASSVPKGRYNDFKKSKTDHIQVLCRQYLGISAPVVWIENDFVGHGLEKKGDWTILNDMEKQPLNLFEAMISLLKESRDDIGLEAVRLCFSGNCSNLSNPKLNLRIPGRTVGKIANKEVELNDKETNWYLDLLKELETLVNTEVTQKLREYTNSHRDVVRFEEMVPLLIYLQKAGIKKLPELETRTLQEIETLLKPFLINRTDKFILLEVFKVQYKSYLNIVQVVGCGYNDENNATSAIRIFDTLDCEFKYNIGIYIPRCIDATPIHKTQITCTEIEQPAHEMDTHDTEVIPARVFRFKIVHNLYTFRTNKYLAKIALNQQFVTSIASLPKSALDDNDTVYTAYRDFFTLYGNLEIYSVIVSGRISGCVTINNNEDKKTIAHQIRAVLEKKITEIKEDSYQEESILEVNFDVENVPLEFAGGDPSHYCPTLNQFSHGKWNAWINSIQSNPIFNPNCYGMSPIYKLVKMVDNVKGNEMKIAYEKIYSGDVILVPDVEDDSFVNLEDAKSRTEAVDIARPSMKENTTNACFPGNASVELRGERVRMDALKIGDYVLSIHPTTGKPVYSRVYLWAHRDPHITATFLHITHPHGHLHISAHHLILSGDQRRPVPADQLRVGDSIHFISPCLSKQEKEGEGEREERGDSHTLISVPVLHIQTCTQVGYYAPFTNNGLIVVDGIAASVFSVTDQSMAQIPYFQTIGQFLFYPMRLLSKLGLVSTVGTYLDKETKIHKYAQFLKDSYQVLK